VVVVVVVRAALPVAVRPLRAPPAEKRAAQRRRRHRRPPLARHWHEGTLMGSARTAAAYGGGL
jgi:hypothetical protein